MNHSEHNPVAPCAPVVAEREICSRKYVPRDTLAQGVSDSAAPVLDCVTVRLNLLDSADLGHDAMLMEIQNLHEFCAAKAKDAKIEHQNAYTHERRAYEIIASNYPFFLALRRWLKNPGRREKIEGIDSWTEWIDRHFNWCSRRTVYRAFRRIEQRLDLLRETEHDRKGNGSGWMPSQREVKTLLKAAPLGAQMSEILLGTNPDFEKAKELAQQYLLLAPPTGLAEKFFPLPEQVLDYSDGFCPRNYNETFPFYPPLVIHPIHGVTGIWFCRPEQRLAGLFWGSYPRGFLKRALSLFPHAQRVLHCPSGTLENLPPGHVTLDLVRDDLRRPMVVGDVHHLPFTDESFDLILCDRPYTAEDAKKYGTPMVSMARFMPEARRVLKTNGYLGILDLITFPVCRKSEWRLRGIIGVVPWSNQRFRTFSLLQKPSEFACTEHSEQEGCEERSRSFAVLQKIACRSKGRIQ